MVLALCGLKQRYISWPKPQQRTRENRRGSFVGRMGKVDGIDVVFKDKFGWQEAICCEDLRLLPTVYLQSRFGRIPISFRQSGVLTRRPPFAGEARQK